MIRYCIYLIGFMLVWCPACYVIIGVLHVADPVYLIAAGSIIGCVAYVFGDWLRRVIARWVS